MRPNAQADQFSAALAACRGNPECGYGLEFGDRGVQQAITLGVGGPMEPSIAPIEQPSPRNPGHSKPVAQSGKPELPGKLRLWGNSEPTTPFAGFQFSIRGHVSGKYWGKQRNLGSQFSLQTNLPGSQLFPLQRRCVPEYSDLTQPAERHGINTVTEVGPQQLYLFAKRVLRQRTEPTHRAADYLGTETRAGAAAEYRRRSESARVISNLTTAQLPAGDLEAIGRPPTQS